MAWSAEQISNAKIVISVGRQLGASERDIMVALMAGFQESGLRNLNYGDRDSIGMFQQRNAWGSRADRLDPVKSARMFFLGGAQGQRGLLDFKNRDQWSLGQAAQKVQVSAFPDAYDKWEDESAGLLKELGGSVGVVTDRPQGTGTTDSTVVPDPLSPAAGQASGALSALGLGSPTSPGSEAAGVDAFSSPGIEAADKQPALNSMDLGGLVDPTVQQSMNIPAELTGDPSGSDFNLPDVASDGSYKPGNYSLPRVKSYVVAAANELRPVRDQDDRRIRPPQPCDRP